MKLSKLVLAATILLSTTTALKAQETDLVNFSSPDLVEDYRDIDEDGSLADLFDSMNAKKNSVNKSMLNSEPFLGLPMRYNTIPHEMADRGNIALAMNDNMGRPIVLWGPITAQQLGPNIMGYFMQHEYGHHDLGHARGQGNPQSAMREADADCAGARSLANYGRQDILREAVNWFNARGCSYDPRTPITQVRDSHPCGTQRAQILRQCGGV